MDPWSPEWFRTSAGQDSAVISGMLALAGDGRKADADSDGRNSRRVPLDMDAGLRRPGAKGVSVQIRDLSATGFRVATHLDLRENTVVWLRLPGLEARQAKVVWTKGYIYGCAFERPLHPAVLEMIVRKSHDS